MRRSIIRTDPMTRAIPTMCTDWIAGMVQALCSWMKTLGGVAASQSANCCTCAGTRPSLERRAADKSGARHRVAVLASRGKRRLLRGRVRRALGEHAHPGTEVRSVPQRVQMHAEHRAGAEARAGDPLLR